MVTVGLPAGRDLGSTEEEGVGASRGTKGELIEGQALSAGLGDASAGAVGEAQGADLERLEAVKTVVVGDGTDKDNDLGLLTAGETGNTGEGHRGTVGARNIETLQHNLVELAAGAASKEGVKLDEKLKIDILGSGGRTVALLDASTSTKIVDTRVDRDRWWDVVTNTEVSASTRMIVPAVCLPLENVHSLQNRGVSERTRSVFASEKFDSPAIRPKPEVSGASELAVRLPLENYKGLPTRGVSENSRVFASGKFIHVFFRIPRGVSEHSSSQCVCLWSNFQVRAKRPPWSNGSPEPRKEVKSDFCAQSTPRTLR